MAEDEAPAGAAQATDRAWIDYRDGIEGIRRRLLALDAAREPGGADRAHRLLMEAQAVAYNLVIAPDRRRPLLHLHSVFAPGLYDWLLPNPDFLYRYAFLDGRGRYRLSGTRGTSLFVDVQTIAGLFGDPDLKLLDSHPLDPLVDEGGGLDIQLSADPPTDGAAWIRLERARLNTVIVREAFDDWSAEIGSTLDLETLDVTGVAPDTGAEAIAAALRMIDFCVATFGPDFCQAVVARAGENRFLHVDTSRDEDASNPGVAYLPAAFRIAADEALVVTIDLPRARYWSLHLADRWSRTANYLDRLTSLNGSQVELSPDGRVDIVVAAADPGVANWLDAGDDPAGMMLLRWYGADRAPVPQVRLVPLDRLGEAMATTVRVSPAERAATIAARRRAVVSRYRR